MCVLALCFLVYSSRLAPAVRTSRQGGYNQSKYYGMVRCIDDNVGKIVEALRDAGVLDRTVVVFTSDHGDLRGEHGRHNKGVPYEGSAKIPFVVYYHGKIRAGTVVDEALDCVDFLPTILSLMGVKSAGKEHGRDASQLLTTGQAPSDWNDIAFLRSTGEERGWLAAVTDRHKLIYSTADTPWLFNLEKDPDELTNMFHDPAYRETVRELSRQLAAYGKKHNDPRAANAHIPADLQWAVRGTGPYVSTRPERPPAPVKAKGGRRKPRKRAGPIWNSDGGCVESFRAQPRITVGSRDPSLCSGSQQRRVRDESREERWTRAWTRRSGGFTLWSHC